MNDQPSLLYQARTLAYRALPPSAHGWLHRIKHTLFTPADEKAGWAERVETIQGAPDYEKIPRAPGAGEVRGGFQTMHNGQRVLAGSYHGVAGQEMLRACRGVHEPQEETAFGEVIGQLPPGSVMIEAGAYWAFYSMWFAARVKDARCFCIEPDERNLAYGRANFEANGLRGSFHHGYLGQEPGQAEDGIEIVAIDAFLTEQKIGHVGMLHADIQGFELDLLQGARDALARHAVDWLFISTHSPELHRACRAFLASLGYHVALSVDLAESYSIDGILAAKAPGAPGPETITIARRPSADHQ